MRKLNSDEFNLIKTLLDVSDVNAGDVFNIENIFVDDLDDGGMGSLRFYSQNRDRKLGQCVVEAEFKDADGVTVSVELNLDNHGDLYELDIWKTDFSALVQWPTEGNITVTKK